MHSQDFFFQAFIYLMAPSVYSQEFFTIKGEVNDEKGQPMLYGDVLLMDENDKVVKFSYIENGRWLTSSGPPPH